MNLIRAEPHQVRKLVKQEHFCDLGAAFLGNAGTIQKGHRLKTASMLGLTMAIFLILPHGPMAAPVNWATRNATGGEASALGLGDDAEALDELTAPLSNEQMGLSSGLQFTTTFDEEIRKLREQREVESDPSTSGVAPPARSDPSSGPILNPLDPSGPRPNLRFVPTLRSVPQF